MKCLLLIALMSLGLSSTEIQASQTHAQAITTLAGHTEQRRNMEWWVNGSAVGGVIVTVAVMLQDNARLNTALTTAFASWVFHMLMWSIKMGHTVLAQWQFKRLYNKRVNTRGSLINSLSAEAYNLPFALDNEQFIAFGQKSGFSTDELIELARNAGRMDIALQLANHSYLKHHLNVVKI